MNEFTSPFVPSRLCVLYRPSNSPDEDDAEIKAIQDAGFVYLKRRTEVQPGDLVVGRYSCWPFYRELEEDIKFSGGALLNTTRQHQYIADLGNWIVDLEEMTPLTWNNLQHLPDEGPFIVKGGTNSRKGFWNTLCYAPDKRAAIEIHGKLSNDSLIGQQTIYIRKFEKLHTYTTDVQGMPITKEFRFFVCDGEVLCGGFYWSHYTDDLGCPPPSPDEVSPEFLAKAISRIGRNARAYALDVWIKENGEPIVGEINDLQQSGLSDNKPEVFYPALYKVLSK